MTEELDNNQQIIDKISNIIKNKSDSDFVMLLNNLTAKGDVNIVAELDKFSKEKNIDVKKMNIIFAYLGDTNKIDGKIKIKMFTDINECSDVSSFKCPEPQKCICPEPQKCICSEPPTLSPTAYGIIGFSSFIIILLAIYTIIKLVSK
jgi:hypothetical protein